MIEPPGNPGCNDCHTVPSYAVGGNPFLGEPEVINAPCYLAGGAAFGPFVSRNITPRANGLPAARGAAIAGQSAKHQARRPKAAGVRYSHRPVIAFVAGIQVARQAGSRLAASATTSSIAATVTNVTGSVGPTP